MNGLDALCKNLIEIGNVGAGESLEFDDKERVKVVKKGGWQQINRKLINRRGQSRHTTIADCRKVLEHANDLVAGVLGLPPLALECSALQPVAKLQSSAASASKPLGSGESAQDSTAAYDFANAEEDCAADGHSDLQVLAFTTHCTFVEREKLGRIAAALEKACVGLNTLMTSTYNDDNDTCAALLMLIASSQSIVERINSVVV